MICLKCKNKLSLNFHLYGKGNCEFCKTQQRILTAHTAMAVSVVMLVGIVGPFQVWIKVLISTFVGAVYLFFSKTEEINIEK
ncbi:hypothetical protein D0C16_12975 [Cellvibrio sp. KY-GH-1]|nr:hypothetical protein D0C16_12975 [Cellvibrio sp. KY-GH-1]